MLSWLGCSPVFCATITSLATLAFFYRHQLTYKYIIQSILCAVIDIFFREVQCRGTYKIPRTGPVIFAVAPHANQFVDPVLVMKVLSRDVGFLAAAVTMRRKYVGVIARAINAIPVERAQDIAKPGTGKVTIKNKVEVMGEGTTFSSELKVGICMVVAGETLNVASIQSDTQLLLAASTPYEKNGGVLAEATKFKVAPKVDQNEVFEYVFQSLSKGQAVGIFPEGGSHDRPDLLPFKAGITIMALGAAAKYGADVRIIPVGLNYFTGHRFRSRAYVDIGDPIMLSPALIEKYKQGGQHKREACAQLLDEVSRGSHGVVATAPDHDTLRLIWAVRRLYRPAGVRLSPAQKVELTRRFEFGYGKLQSDPRIQRLAEQVGAYNRKLDMFGLRDHQISSRLQDSKLKILFRLFLRSLKLISLVLVALPGFILNLPILITADRISKQKSIEALKASSVKLEGKDVLATWKVMVGMALLPLCFIIYPLLAALVGWVCGWGAVYTWSVFAIFQLPVMYGSVRFVEQGLDISRSLHSLLLALILNHGINELNNDRQQLATTIRELVNELGPEVLGPDFQEQRIIKAGDFEKANKDKLAHSPKPVINGELEQI